MRTRVAIVLAVTATASGATTALQPPASTEFASKAVVVLTNGSNAVDLDGDGKADIVFVAWRENFNAHGFDYLTFYHFGSDVPTWSLVPFEGADGKTGFTSFQTYQGADCVLRDLRILRPAEPARAEPAVIVVAERLFGESFMDRQTVTFTIYRAQWNKKGIPGWAPFYFRATGTVRSGSTYCDVGDAFQAELGIGLPKG